jgi:hypothetical protein
MTEARGMRLEKYMNMRASRKRFSKTSKLTVEILQPLINRQVGGRRRKAEIAQLAVFALSTQQDQQFEHPFF